MNARSEIGEQAPTFRHFDRLACPRTGSALVRVEGGLRADDGRVYPVLGGIPVLLDESFGDSRSGAANHTYRFLRDVIDPAELVPPSGEADCPPIDPVVQRAIAATGGNLYRRLVGRLEAYPIPEFPSGPGRGEVLLDLGSHWGRWTLAAARAGYAAIWARRWPAHALRSSWGSRPISSSATPAICRSDRARSIASSVSASSSISRGRTSAAS